MAKQSKKIDKIPQAVGNKVCIKLDLTEETESGIILPNASCDTGTIINVGNKCDVGIASGDFVFLSKGDSLGDRFQVNDNVYLVTSQEYISCILGKA